MIIYKISCSIISPEIKFKEIKVSKVTKKLIVLENDFITNLRKDDIGKVKGGIFKDSQEVYYDNKTDFEKFKKLIKENMLKIIEPKLDRLIEAKQSLINNN